MSAQAIGMWAKKAGAPTELKKGQMKLLWPRFAVWYGDQREEGGKRSAAPKNINEARERLDQASAELKEYELMERRNELMTVDQHAKVLSDAFARVASKLKNLKRTVAMNVTAGSIPEREQQAGPLVDEVMAELSKGDDIPVPEEEEVA